MAKKQTRRSISVRGTTYAAIAADCAARDVSLSEYVEALIAADRAARGIGSTTVASAVAAVQRAGDRQVERAARAVQAATAAPAATPSPAPRGTTGTAELGELVTEEANRLIPRLPAGWSAEDLEVAGRAAAAEAVRIFEPSGGVRLVDAARPLVRRAMTDRLRDVREEATAAAAPTATATARPAAPKPAPVVATAAAAPTAPRAAGSTSTATAGPRPTFRRHNGGISDSERIWNLLEGAASPMSTQAIASALGIGYFTVSGNIRRLLDQGFVGGNGRGWSANGAVQSRPAAPAAAAPMPRESSIKAGPPPEQTAMLGREETPLRRSMPPADPVRGVRPPSPISNRSSREPTLDDLEEIDEEERRPPRLAPARLSPIRRPPRPIPEGSPAGSATGAGRPPGLRVEPVRQRSAEETKKIAKVDPIAAVHAGRSGVQF